MLGGEGGTQPGRVQNRGHSQRVYLGRCKGHRPYHSPLGSPFLALTPGHECGIPAQDDRSVQGRSSRQCRLGLPAVNASPAFHRDQRLASELNPGPDEERSPRLVRVKCGQAAAHQVPGTQCLVDPGGAGQGYRRAAYWLPSRPSTDSPQPRAGSPPPSDAVTASTFLAGSTPQTPSIATMCSPGPPSG